MACGPRLPPEVSVDVEYPELAPTADDNSIPDQEQPGTEPEDPPGTGPEDPPSEPEETEPFVSTLCDDAAWHLAADCGLANALTFHGVCMPHFACESSCVLQTECAVFQGTATAAAAAAYNACVLACYALGEATCADAEAYVGYCDLELDPEWNQDGFCDAEETCVSNCAVSVGCYDLAGWGPEASFFQGCMETCEGAGLREAPLTFGAEYCQTYGEQPECTGGAQGAVDAHCLVYPAAAECQDPDEFCTDHPEDSYCTSEAGQCARDPSAGACAAVSPFCVEHADFVRCQTDRDGSSCPVDWNVLACDPALACELYPYASICTYTDWTSYCVDNPDDELCHGADDHDDYCDYYPNSPECDPSGTYCAWYPDSPECDDVYLPYCVKWPDDPDC
jgi:hypothetical protein